MDDPVANPTRSLLSDVAHGQRGGSRSARMLIQRTITKNKKANIPMSSRSLSYFNDLKRKKTVERTRVAHQKPPTAAARDKRTQSMPRVVSMSHMLTLCSTPTIIMAVTVKRSVGEEK